MPQKSEWLKHYGTLADGGPIYAETNLENFIAEPWNALSSIAILLPALYWLWVLRKQYKEYIFIISCCPLLFLGGLGSTLFHAFRKYEFFLILDFLPIIILSIAVSFFLWQKVLGKWYWAILVYIFPLSFRFFVAPSLTPHNAINISYFINGVMMFLPAIILFARTNYLGWKSLLASIGIFMLALYFRKIDANIHTGIGTHWLWHIFCGIGAFLISHYLYLLSGNNRKISLQVE